MDVLVAQFQTHTSRLDSVLFRQAQLLFEEAAAIGLAEPWVPAEVWEAIVAVSLKRFNLTMEMQEAVTNVRMDYGKIIGAIRRDYAQNQR